MAKKGLRIDVRSNIPARQKLYFKKLNVNKSPGVDYNVKIKVGLQLLNWTINGSSSESTVPPIMFGILRGSGTVFVGSKQVGDMKNKYPKGTPASTYSGKRGEITIGFNTGYAARLHETSWVPGGKIPSKQAAKTPAITGDVGNKFLEKHIKADAKAALKMWAMLVKKRMG